MVDAETDRALPYLAPHTPKALCSDAAGIVSVAMCLLKTIVQSLRSLTSFASG